MRANGPRWNAAAALAHRILTVEEFRDDITLAVAIERALDDAYLAGFRAAREATVKVAVAWTDPRDGGAGHMDAVANIIRSLPDPQPGTAGDAKETP